MSWQDRVRQAAYLSPNGNRITFDFEDVSKQVDKRTSGFNFPDADGTLVQDLGRSGHRYPLRVIFWGSDHDLEASNFETILLEKGEGVLEHPFYGVVNVVPFGTITRSDKLVTEGNQTVIEVVFWETIGASYPTGGDDPFSSILSALSGFDIASATEAVQNFDLSSVIEGTTTANEFQAVLDQSKSGLQSLVDIKNQVNTAAITVAQARQTAASVQQQAVNVRQQFEGAYSSITKGLGG